MRVNSFVKIRDRNINQYVILLAVIVGVFVSSWIIENSGLRPGHGANEWARFLAKGCVTFSTMSLFIWVFNKVVVKWYKYREKPDSA